jgi:phage terminase large subunit GpA-like protein
MTRPSECLIGGWSVGATPPPRLTVSEWADEKRYLPEKSAAAGARWRTDRVPYLRGIMDAVHEPGIKALALEKSAQVGGTSAIENIIGYFVEHDPCAMLLIQPTDQAAQEFSKERLADLIRTTPALDRVIDDSDESTLSLLMFAGGFLALGSAKSPNSFARRAVRIAIADDFDRFPAVVGEEGDPGDLLVNRTTTYYNGLVIYVSTPTLKGGRIDSLFQRSDQRRYHVSCPCCGREDWITWSDAAHFHVGFDGRDPTSARLECASDEHGGCSAILTEATRRQMVLAGDWRPTATAQEAGLVGFHLPAMVTTLGTADLETWVGAWLGAREKGKDSLKVFINTTLAEGWEDRGARMDPHKLEERIEDYGEDVEIPAGAAALTAGVDVQDNRFEIVVMAWGLAGERWIVDHRILPADPRRRDDYAQIVDELHRRYRHASGVQLPIHATCIDSGYATDQVYDFVLAHEGRLRLFCTKGFAGRAGNPIVGKPSEARPGKNPRPVRLYPINVDDAKTEVMNALTREKPGPGFLHLPTHIDTVNEEFCAQLCAEHREVLYNKSKVAVGQKWVQDRERNEALDLAVLCLAAVRLLRPNVRQMLEQLATATAPRETSSASSSSASMPPPAPPNPHAIRPGRRFSRSPSLG